MNKLKVTNLKAGMRFSEDAYLDNEGSLFVPAEFPIKQKDLDRLKRWEISEVFTSGQIIEDDFLFIQDSPIFQDVLTLKENSVTLRVYTSVITEIEGIFKNINEVDSLKFKTVIEEIVNKLMPIIKSKKEEMISLIILSGQGKSRLSISSINCMILSVIIGMEIKLSEKDLNTMASASLLHDIGMLKIPSTIVEKTGILDEKEKKLLNTHPIHSYKIVIQQLKYPAEIGKIILQHHERWDGKGYPGSAAGKKIHLFARVISVADAFEAMVSTRPYRNSMIGYQAMRQLLNDNSRRFDSNVLKIFIKTMGIYPIGSIVLLNDASIARVMGIHQEAPLRPKVKIIVDKDGVNLSEREGEIDLLNISTLFIAKAITIDELKKV